MSEAISNLRLKDSSEIFGYKLFIRNETSHTLFSRPELIHLVELKEKGMILALPLNVCQKGHSLSLFFVDRHVELKSRLPDSGPLKEASFTAMAKTESVEAGAKETNTAIVELNFTQFDNEIWKKILEKVSAQQETTTRQIFNQHLVRDEE